MQHRDEPTGQTRADNYSDWREFVAAKLKESKRSRTSLSTYLGVSKALLSHALSGDKRLNPKYIEMIAEFFELEAEEASMFSALCDLDNGSERARRSARATVEARRAYLASNAPSTAALDVLSKWYMAAVLGLAFCDGFHEDPNWISATLVPSITVEQAREALDKLIEVGLLIRDDRGKLTGCSSWTAPRLEAGKRSKAVYELQVANMALGRHAAERHRANERHQSTMTIALSEKGFERIRARIAELEQEVFQLALHDDPDDKNRVLTMNLQLFPVSMFTDTEYDPTEIT